MVFCHRRLAVMNYFKDRSSHQYFITQGMGQTSMFLIPFALYKIKILVGENLDFGQSYDDRGMIM